MSPQRIPLVVHVTHEAGVKLGGIGAVLDGLLGSSAYNASVARTILTGPDQPVRHGRDGAAVRARATSSRSSTRRSTATSGTRGPEQVVAALQAIEQTMNVQFLYGTRTIAGRDHEILLVDAGGIAANVINSYKFYLWQRWGLDCGKHEGNWEFSFFLNAGEPLYAGCRPSRRTCRPASPAT